MESDSSEESLASADRKLAPTKKAPKMAIMIEDAVSNCSDRKGATPAYIRNYILGKYPELDRTRFKTTFKKAFLTAIEKKALLRTKATETALGLSGRVKLAPKVKPSRKAPTPPESQGSSNAGPSSKASPKKTKKSGAASTVDRTKGAEAKKPAEGQRKRGAGAKEPVADTTKDSSTSGKKTPSSSVAPAKGVKDTKVPVSKAPKGRGAAVKRGKANLEEMKATEKEEVPVEKRKNTVSNDEYAFVDVEQSGDNQSSPSSFSATDQSDEDESNNEQVRQTGWRVELGQESDDSSELPADEGYAVVVESPNRSETAKSIDGEGSVTESEDTAGEAAENTVRNPVAEKRPGKKVANKKLAGPKKTATIGTVPPLRH